MATAAPPASQAAPPPPAAAHPSQAGEWVKIIASAVLAALLAAIFTFFATERLNDRSAVQQQNLAAIQEFNTTGARVDAAITELSDTVLDGAQLTEARKDARQAIAAHVAATQSLAWVVGTGNEKLYMAGLATLRKLVDETSNQQEALRTSRARFDLMENRSVIVAEARRRVYGNS